MIKEADNDGDGKLNYDGKNYKFLGPFLPLLNHLLTTSWSFLDLFLAVVCILASNSHIQLF